MMPLVPVTVSMITAATVFGSSYWRISDQQDAVLPADPPHALEVAGGRDDDAIGAGDRLHDHRRHGLRVLVLEDLLEVWPAGADRTRIGVSGRAAVGIGIEHPDHARDARLGRPAPRVAGQGDGAGRGPVVGAVAGDDLLPARVPAGQLDGVLVGLGAAVG